MFRLYLEHGTAAALCDAANQRGLTTKRRCRADGRKTGGKTFTRGNLYNLLSNPLYIGQVSHKGTLYPGQHEAIIDRETFEAVGRQQAGNAVGRRMATNAKAPSLLSGLAYDETGDRLGPTHANKKGRRYRYYISKRLMHGTGDGGDGWRVPADALENTVLHAIETLLQDEHRIVEELQGAGITIDRIRSAVSDRATPLATLEDKQVLHRLLRRVTLGPEAVRLEIDRVELVGLISGMEPDSFSVAEKVFEYVVPIRLQRRGVEAKLVVRGLDKTEARVDPKLIAYVARGHRWFDELAGGTIGSINKIAARDGIDASDVGRSLQLAFLAPDIVEAILTGRQPVELTMRRLRRIGTLPVDWDSQRRLLGFDA